jgi:hypothetical protein
VAAAVASVVAAVLCAPPAAAQGNLAVQGLGYAPGQLSSATRGIGGAAAEFDPLTPINPATLALWGRPAVYLQFEPEARKTTTPTSTDATGASRFPLLATGLALGSRVAIGASFSTFLDRTSAVTRQGFQTIGGDTVGFTETARVRGAIADSRLGVAVSLPFQVALGVGLHAYTGEHRLNDRRGYDPDSPYVGYAFDRVVRYSGRAVSAGMTWQPIRWFGLGASLRTGGRLDAVNEAAALNVRADAPSRWSVAVKTEPARCSTREPSGRAGAASPRCSSRPWGPSTRRRSPPASMPRGHASAAWGRSCGSVSSSAACRSASPAARSTSAR